MKKERRHTGSRVVDATLRLVDRFTSPLQSAAQQVRHQTNMMSRNAKQIQNVGKAISNVGSSMSAKLTVPIVTAGAASFKMASDMNESMSKTEVAFKKNASQIQNWSKTTLEQYGISQGAALEYASKYGDMATGMGMTTKQAAKLSKNITGLVGDLASFKNISQEQADVALTSIFTGETESLKQLGIVMTQTNLLEYAKRQGIKKDIKDMTQREQVMLRYGYVMSVTKNAQGDFNRTNNQAANQMRIAQEGVKQLGASLGSVLLPHITKIIRNANDLITKFNGMSSSQQKLIVKILGVVAAIGPCILIFGKMVTAVGNAYMAWTRFMRIMNRFGGISSIIATPGGKVVLILAGIVAAAILVYKNWDKISAGAKKMAKIVVKAMNDAGIDTKKLGLTVRKIGKTVSNAFTAIGKGGRKIIDFLGPVVPYISGFFKLGFLSTIRAITGAFAGWLKSVIEVISGVKTTFSGIIDFISGIFTGNWEKAWKGVQKIFSGVFQGLAGVIKTPINIVIGMINAVIGGLNKIKLPSWVPKIGGKGINIPKIPMLAKGTDYWTGGIAQVHEKGGEIIDLPRGTRVYPHDESIRKARKEGQRVYRIDKLADQIIVREEADIDKIAEKIVKKLEAVVV